VTNEWAWAYTLDKRAGKGLVDEYGNPTNYGAAVAIYKRVAAKYGNPDAAPTPVLGPALTRAELIALHTPAWVVSRGFAWAANDSFTARLFHTEAGDWRIERVFDDHAQTSPIERDTVLWLLRDAPNAAEWAGA
jgi:hypothetical protein